MTWIAAVALLGPGEPAAAGVSPSPGDTSAGGAKAEEGSEVAADALGVGPLRLDGYFWTDTGQMKRTNAREGQFDQTSYYMQGRFVLSAEYREQLGSVTARARSELIGFVNEFTKSQFEAHVLDAYAQVGQAWWDVQVGRFLAWEVYHRGAGIELFTAEEAGALGGPPLYWLQLTRGYQNEAGQLAVHLYPWEWLGLEVAGVYGQEQSQNTLGIRPVVDFHRWGLQAIAGYEFSQQAGQTEADKVKSRSSGFAGKLQYTLSVVTAGASVGKRRVRYTNVLGDRDGERTLQNHWSAGGFLNVNVWHGQLGLGYHHTTQKNLQGEEIAHDQGFASLLFWLPIDGLGVKAVYGFATAHVEDIDVGSEWDNDMRSARVRLVFDPWRRMDALDYPSDLGWEETSD
jgi:hypothetical protein